MPASTRPSFANIPVDSSFIDFFETSGGSSDFTAVAGSLGSPIDFLINADPTKDRFLQAIRIVTNASGVKFQQFLSKSGIVLPNGIELRIRSNGIETVFPLLTTTDDLFNTFSIGSDNFNFITGAGDDQLRFTRMFEAPLPQLFKGTADFMRLRVQDDLTSDINNLQALAFGLNI